MRGRRGMTLLEVSLALGLLAILSVFVMQVMNSVTDLWSSGERRGRGDLVFAQAVERLRARRIPAAVVGLVRSREELASWTAAWTSGRLPGTPRLRPAPGVDPAVLAGAPSPEEAA